MNFPSLLAQVGSVVQKVLQDCHGDAIVTETDCGELGTLSQGRQKQTKVRLTHPTMF